MPLPAHADIPRTATPLAIREHARDLWIGPGQGASRNAGAYSFRMRRTAARSACPGAAESGCGAGKAWAECSASCPRHPAGVWGVSSARRTPSVPLRHRAYGDGICAAGRAYPHAVPGALKCRGVSGKAARWSRGAGRVVFAAGLSARSRGWRGRRPCRAAGPAPGTRPVRTPRFDAGSCPGLLRAAAGR